MLTAAVLTAAKMLKQSKRPATNGWIGKLWYMHMMDYYSGFKEKEILSYVATGMNLQDTMLSEIYKSEKEKYCMIPLR